MRFLGYAVGTLALVAGFLGCSSPEPVSMAAEDIKTPNMASLSDLSIKALRNRSYHSNITIESKMDGPCVDADKVTSAKNARGTYQTYMASYLSDGLRVYTRINIPDGQAQEGGYPVIIFAHGWVGAENAPSYTLGCDPASMYSEITDAYSRAGFMVFTPGYRGHATVNGVPGEGIDYLRAWDNGTYLSTQFYAVDVLNLMAGMTSSGVLKSELLPEPITFKTDEYNLSGHSQGGDVALTVLAATGEGAKNGLKIENASIWSGAIADRIAQMQFFNPLESTPEAFISGDGTWTGTATGHNGEVNPNFIFGYPPEWIGSVDTSEWTWQKNSWKYDSVKSALKPRLDGIYERFNAQVGDISGATYELSEDETGRAIVKHDPELLKALNEIGGYNFEEYIKEPVRLHFPDRDYISPPQWNYDLCERVNRTGGTCTPYEYPQNNHGMRVSKHAWFSGESAVSGYATMVDRDIAYFKGENVAQITFPPTNPIEDKRE